MSGDAVRGGFDSHTFPPSVPARERRAPASPWSERVLLRRSIVVVWLIAALSVLGATGTATTHAQVAEADTSAAPADTTAAAAESAAEPADSLRAVTVTDSLGIPGTLKGRTDYDPVQVKEVLGRMGSGEIQGRTTWERKKNPRTAMLCSALLPGLGQTYNGRRLKVGLMVGFASYYMGNMILNWHLYEEYAQEYENTPPGSSAHRLAGDLAEFHKEEARTFLWWSGAVWLIGILDSWIDAHLYDVREYTPPSPPQAGVPRTEGGDVSYLTIGIGLSIK